MKHFLGICTLCLFGIIIGIISVEIMWFTYGHFFPLPNTSSEFNRYIYLYGGQHHVFKNYDDFYVFSPNDKLRVVGANISTGAPLVEFDYYVQTNNFGLIDDRNLEKHIDSLLLVGDSFTAGEGAEPWVQKISSEIRELNFQPINGGIIGAGFGHFAKVDDLLSRHQIAIRKIIVIFISDDYVRPVHRMPTEAIKCVENILECDGSDVLYPAPLAGDLTETLEKIRELAIKRDSANAGVETVYSNAKRKLKALFPATNVVYSFVRKCFDKGCLTSYINICSTKGCEDSNRAIRTIVDKYGAENVLFVHLPEKLELDKGPNWIGEMARKEIANAHARLFDGFRECNLTADDYYAIDGHPNQRGYDKIANCVMKAVAIVTQQ